MFTIIKKVEISNFMSMKNVEFDFDEHQGMNLVNGRNLDIKDSKNGCGKSTLMNSIIFALFGRVPYEVPNMNMKNWFGNGSDMNVNLDFESNCHSYRIETGIHRSTQFCNLFKTDDGAKEDITKSTLKETRKYLEKEIILMNFNDFMNIVYLNNDPSYNFFNLKKEQKKSFIESMFDIEIFGKMFAIAHDRRRNLERESKLVNEEIMSRNRNLEEYESKKDNFENEKSNKISDLQDKIAKINEKISILSKNSVDFDEDRAAKYSKAMNEITSRIVKITNEKNSKAVKIESLKVKIKSNESRISVLDKEIKKRSDVIPNLCEHCEKVYMKHYNLDDMENEIKSLNDSISKMKNDISSLNDEIKEKNAAIKKYTDAKTGKLDDFKKKEAEYRKYESDMKVLSGYLSQGNISLENLKNSINPYETMISDCKEKISELQDRLSTIKRDFNNSKLDESILSEESVKKYIAQKYIPVINDRLNSLLRRTGVYFRIEIDSEMDYRLITNDGIEASLNNFSAGEKMRIFIITRLAFREAMMSINNSQPNILILDEFLDQNIDSLGISKIVEILQEYASSGTRVYVISHRSEVDRKYFNGIVEVTKKNGVSDVEYMAV